MDTVVSLFYFLAAVMALYVLYHRVSRGVSILFLAALFFGLDSQGWFFTSLTMSAYDWPVRSVHEALVLTAGGVKTPTTLPELLVVAVGRLAVILALIYGGVYLVRHFAAIKSNVMLMPLARLSWIVLWACGAVAALAFDVLGGADADPLTGVAQVVAGFSALALASIALLDFSRSRRVSGSKESSV